MFNIPFIMICMVWGFLLQYMFTYHKHAFWQYFRKISWVFFQKDEKNTKTKKHWYTGCLYLADLQWCWKEKTTHAASRISKKIIFVWYLYVILNYRMNHSCKVYYYFNSLINWRHIINKFKYYKKTMLSLTKKFIP